MDYGPYQPFYDQLCRKLPELSHAGEIFQFALPTIELGKDDKNSMAIYRFLDALPSAENYNYAGGAGYLTEAYEDYLECLDTFKDPELEKRVNSALSGMKKECVEITAGGRVLLLPQLEVEKQNALFEKENLKFDFSSRAFEKDPVTVSGEGLSGFLRTKEYKFQIEVCGLRCFRIQRGTWFDETLLNPGYPILDGGMLEKKTFWGKEGAFRLLPQSVLTVKKIQINLSLGIFFSTMLRKEYGAEPAMPEPAMTGPLLFLGIPIEFGAWGSLCREKSGMDGFQECFPEGEEAVSILGVTSKVF